MTTSTPEQERRAMRHAIVLSSLGLGTTSPNPPVGCVLLDPAGQPAGQGWHRRKGEPHAEANAVAEAGTRARGGTAVVTLEPCCHHGRTPPCHQALLDAGVSRVLIATLDPTSRDRGGAALLREAGLDVEVGLLADEVRTVLGSWLTALERRRPVVTWSYSLTVEGTIHGEPTPAGTSPDVVIDTDGIVRETSPGTHGYGALALPTNPLPADPHLALEQLYQAGARTVLLATDSQHARPYLETHLIDTIHAHFSVATPSAWAVRDGFRITALDTTSTGIRLHATLHSSAARLSGKTSASIPRMTGLPPSLDHC